MPDAYVIQVSGRTAGIVARDSRDRSFNFFAAAQPFSAMEGRRFSDPLAAERAARHLAKYGNLPRGFEHISTGTKAEEHDPEAAPTPEMASFPTRLRG